MAEDKQDAGSNPDPKRHRCPSCGSPVYRGHRRGNDRLVGLFRDVRRYRCGGCPWEGLLPAGAHHVEHRGDHLQASLGWPIASALILLPTVALLLAWMITEVREEIPALPVPAAGLRLDVADPRVPDAGAPHELRRGCTWTGPEASPYTGTFRDALASSGVPPDAAAKLELLHERGIASDRLTISSTGIESTDRRRHFSLTASALAFDQTVCFTTRMEMAPQKVITADLYEVVDAVERRFAVMVVPDGGNVAVVEEERR